MQQSFIQDIVEVQIDLRHREGISDGGKGKKRKDFLNFSVCDILCVRFEQNS